MVLGHPVVVREDRGRADVRVLADVGVAHVGQVRHLGALAHGGVLQLHVGADVRPRADPGARAQPCVRPDARAGADLGRLADAVQDRRVLPHRGIPEQAVRADPGAGPDVRPSLQVGTGQDLRVRCQRHVHVHPGRRRIHDRDAGPHPVLEQAAIEGSLRLGELDPVVHPLDLRGVGGEDRSGQVAVAAHDAHHVGEVLLALRVAGGDPLDRVGQQGAVKGVAAGVDLVDGPLRRGRVGILHDLGQRAAVVPDDAPVPGRIGDPRGEHGHRVSRGGVLTDQRGQRLRAQQRHVRVGDHDDAGQVAERLGHHPDRVAGAAQPVLHHHPHVRGAPGRFGADLVPAVTGHHDEALRAESGRRRQRVPEHAATAQGMQHLRDARSHPRTLARGEDDDSDRARLAHGGKSPRVARRPLRSAEESTRRTASRHWSGCFGLRDATAHVFTRPSSAGYRPAAMIGWPVP